MNTRNRNEELLEVKACGTNIYQLSINITFKAFLTFPLLLNPTKVLKYVKRLMGRVYKHFVILGENSWLQFNI
jgi:hypothetical protein